MTWLEISTFIFVGKKSSLQEIKNLIKKYDTVNSLSNWD
jgi:hypothetical protein